jgi:hypothetical protein
MRTRSILAFLILIFACVLQSWFVSINIFIDLILATLIVFSFFFDIGELLVFVLFGVFVINWQPGISLEIILFAAIPFIVYGFYRLFALIPWITAPLAIIGGFLIFYIAISPGMLFSNAVGFLMDLFGGLIFGELVFFALTNAMSNGQ